MNTLESDPNPNPVQPAHVDRWALALGEHEHLEFKEAKEHFDPRRLRMYCVALANEGGGHLLLGVTDSRPRRVVGTRSFDNPAKLARELFDSLGFRVDIHEVAHPDGRVLVLQVPSRPRGTAFHFEGAYLMRAGESLMPMSEDRLRTIFAEGKQEWIQLDARQPESAEQTLELLDHTPFFRLQGLPCPTSASGIVEQLIAHGLVRRAPDGFVVLRLGALVLARDLSQFPETARRAPRILVYKGDSKLETKLDRTWSSGYAVDFGRLVEFVDAQLPQREVLDRGMRKSIRMIDADSLRELIANALIHQDFEARGSQVMIEVYADRLEISNPGSPLVPADRFIDGYRSRNEPLADILRRLRICEERGSGIDRVVLAAEREALPAPEFHAGCDRTVVRIMDARPFASMSRMERTRATYQHACLCWVRNRPMTNLTLRERFDLPAARSLDATRTIRATLAAGLIKVDHREGRSRKLAKYLPSWA